MIFLAVRRCAQQAGAQCLLRGMIKSLFIKAELLVFVSCWKVTDQEFDHYMS
jgi:hypothetical protein